MRWPSDQDYNEAIQNPKTAFDDADLQSGVVESYATGIPKARSGNFASVYKVLANGSSYAVKCFRYENPEYSRRYPAIATHLTDNRLSCFAYFRYMSQGIRVGGRWYPILKMRWVEGESLISYVEKNLNSAATLQRLAADWAGLLTDLQKAKIAHGDLQHGNVLVVGGSLKLVDYDGMYVPALDGSRGLEIGHRNYQHPERSELDFGPYLDNFSAWLIYVSILALSCRPALWRELKSGDECLLFRKQDLVSPDQSEAFRLLKAVPEANIRNLVERVEEFLWISPSRIPPIDGAGVSPKPIHSASASPVLADWISDHVAERKFMDRFGVGEDAEGEPGDPSWIQDHVETVHQVGHFQNAAITDSLAGLLMWFALMAVWSRFQVPFGALSWAIGGLFACCAPILFWYCRYRKEPIRSDRRIAKATLTDAVKEATAAQHELETVKTSRQRRRKIYTEEMASFKASQLSIEVDEAAEQKRIDGELRGQVDNLGKARRSLAAQEADEKRKLLDRLAVISNQIGSLSGQHQQELTHLDSGLGSKVRGVEAQLRQVLAQRDSELAQELRDHQDSIVNGHLQRYRIADASVAGIGTELKRRLAQAGYVSARDLGTRNVSVPGVGSKKWDALTAWKKALDKQIRSREAPAALPLHTSASIEQRYEPTIKQLRQTLSLDKTQLSAATDALRKKYADQKYTLEMSLASEEAVVRQQTQALEIKFDFSRQDLLKAERDARLRAEKASEECKQKSKDRDTEVRAEMKRIEKAYMDDIASINRELAISTKRVRELTWRHGQALRTWDAFEPFGFRRYCLRALGRR